LFSIVFTDHQGKSFDNTYYIGGDKQKYFEEVLHMVGVNPKEKIVAKEVLNKRLWICVKEIVDINDDTICIDVLGNEVKNFYIFKIYPFVDGGFKPQIQGDPERNDGRPSGIFRTFRNVGVDFSTAVVKEVEEIKMDVPKNEQPMPNFDLPVEQKVTVQTAITPATDFLQQKPAEVPTSEITNNLNKDWDMKPTF
jgi:hypothetical protein